MHLLGRMSRTVLSIPGTSSQSFILPRNLSAAQLKQNGNKDTEFANQLNNLLPSKNFKKSLDGRQTKLLKKILPEVELFAYMGDRVPQKLEDSEWASLIEHPTVEERVQYLEHIALKNTRAEREANRKNERHEEHLQRLQEEQAKFDRGEMGYGPGMHQLMLNPMRNHKHMHHVEGARIWSAMRVQQPKLIYDMQCVMEEPKKNQAAIARQMAYVVAENFEARPSLQLGFANVPKNEKDKEWLKRTLGHFSSEYASQRIMPEFSERSVKELTRGDKEVVYISRFATEYLDGPLTADAYVVCCSMDRNKQSLGAARRANIRAVKMPIQRYIKWESGPMYIPFPNIAKIFRELLSNGGNWKLALEKYIAKRHLMTTEERESLHNQVSRRKLRLRNRAELIQSIRDATGNE